MYIMTFMFLLSLFVPLMVYSMSLMLYMKSSFDRMKMTPFECGFDSMNKSRIPFSTRFFLLSLLFIVFDIEVVMISPFPVLMNISINYSMMMTFMMIMMILLIGLIHEWNEGSLNWND